MTTEKNGLGSDSRGMDGLTEVLRLQAEALSRISERMADARGVHGDISQGIPSPSHEPAREQVHLPARASDPALTEESLPVLNSFKKFLDQERRRSRQRMLWILFGFSIIIAGVLAIIVRVSDERARALESDIVQAKAKAEQARAETGQELRQMGEKASIMAAQNASQMRKDITRNILWAHSMISSNVNSEFSGRDNDIERLKDKVSSLEIENAMVSRKVMELEQRLKELEDVRDKAEMAVLEGQMREQDAIATSNRPAAAGMAPVLINSAKFGRSFQLRVPQE